MGSGVFMSMSTAKQHPHQVNILKNCSNKIHGCKVLET